MLEAFALSLRQLGDPPILKVLAKSLAVTILLLATLGVGLWFSGRAIAQWAGAGNETAGIAAFAALMAGVAFGWLLFRVIAVLVIGLFADDVVVAVERLHYPKALASARTIPFPVALAMGLRSAGRAIGWNLVASPFYILLLATGIGTAIGFFVVNALLLGRDLGDMVAARHMPRSALGAFRSETRWRRALLGASGTALMLIPFVNLLAPVLGAAMATHVFHRRLRP